MNPSTSRIPIPEPGALSREMAGQLLEFLTPLLVQLDARLDVRLVRTFAATLASVVRQRERSLSWLVSELGERLTDGAHAPAGVKRVWRLLRCPRWEPRLIDTWLVDQATESIERAQRRDGLAFAVLDGSVVEKPAARVLDGLSKQRSALARRLQRAGGGPPPPIPTLVPGFGWIGVVVTGLSGSFILARMHWFSPTVAEGAERQRTAERTAVLPFLLLWAQQLIWLGDRGFGNAPFLSEGLGRARFVARWRQDYPLRDRTTDVVAAASSLSRRLRSRWTEQITDPWSQQTWTMGLVSLAVSLPDDARPLWLVVARRKGKNQTLWLVTTEDASTQAGARLILHAYGRRWQVEWAFRFGKSDLGIASVRVESWLYREKLWRLAMLVHAFLLTLLVLLDPTARARLLRWCHRTGYRARAAIAPLYRLHHALANLWNSHPPSLAWSL
jgi:hypothetical protein